MHGTDDLIAPINGGSGVLRPAVLAPLRDKLQFWLESDGCAAGSTVTMLPDLNTEDGSTIELRQFQRCDTYTGVNGIERTAEVWFYRIEGGGNIWPGAPDFIIPPDQRPAVGNINRDMNASSEMWNFFNRHVLSRSVSIASVAPETF